MKIQNPVLRGFHPDPSIVRVGKDYYIATSTFEWWPGVKLSHSTDLVHWEDDGYILTDPGKLDLRGVGISQGIWAPCLTWHKGIFYLAYTVVRAFYCNMYDTENYLVKSENIHGPWSAPIPLNNFGFDPSLFHDDDGKKYMVSMVTDHRVPKKYAGRLILQEYDDEKEKMVGPWKEIYRGDKIFLEGPHIFKRKGWYYLFCADTGTGEGHGQTVLRSRSVWGPYEMFQADFMERKDDKEAWSILTSRHHPDILLQKSGHCDMVETADGQWYMVHLCGRAGEGKNPSDWERTFGHPRFAGERRYPLGRETAIQKVAWTEDDWPVLEGGGTTPFAEVSAPGCREEWPESLSESPAGKICERDTFDSPVLRSCYQSLRIPMTKRYISLTERPGYLRMYGRSGLSSWFSQSLIARRITEFDFSVMTALEFEPEVFKEMAGLIVMYDTDNYLYLHLTWDEEVGRCICLLKGENRVYENLSETVPVKEGPIYLKAVSEKFRLRFYYGYDEDNLMPIGEEINGDFMSDEACMEGWFTGSMTGICCQDLTGLGKYADFQFFEYKTGDF